ncbi:MAG: MFS transporter [Pseudoclavibacter caeni]|jgi:MFS family permease
MRRLLIVLAILELASGVLQGWFTPLYTDLARHLGVTDAEVNWLGTARSLVSLAAVPVLARLGDAVGHRRMLRVTTVIVAACAWLLPLGGPVVFVGAWAVMGVFASWLPLGVALLALGHAAGATTPAVVQGTGVGRFTDSASASRLSANGGDAAESVAQCRIRVAGSAARTASAARTGRDAGLIVAMLQLGLMASGAVSGALADRWGGDVTRLLVGPAVLLTIGAVATWALPALPVHRARVDVPGALLLTASLLGVGVIPVGFRMWRQAGQPAGAWLMLAGALVAVMTGGALVRVERAGVRPIVDLRGVERALLPVLAVSALFGLAALATRTAISTYARTDPAVHGYGLGLDAGATGLVLTAMGAADVLGSLGAAAASRRGRGTRAMAVGLVAVGVGFLALLVPSDPVAIAGLVVAGLGEGLVVPGLPALAASRVPADRTGMATGASGMCKTIGSLVGSVVFALALSVGQVGTDGSLSGYHTVWTAAGAAGLVGAAVLLRRGARAA